mmetsp:Transcript_31976/g.68075  ORF Transcript_31976/g.68075 Transcript_31976/m.68075 type:complete len:147 (-) Transcript_31976:142-582(-)
MSSQELQGRPCSCGVDWRRCHYCSRLIAEDSDIFMADDRSYCSLFCIRRGVQAAEAPWYLHLEEDAECESPELSPMAWGRRSSPFARQTDYSESGSGRRLLQRSSCGLAEAAAMAGGLMKAVASSLSQLASPKYAGKVLLRLPEQC